MLVSHTAERRDGSTILGQLPWPATTAAAAAAAAVSTKAKRKEGFPPPASHS
ncbi:hypothetical protein [Achromobacter phage emuu_LB7]|nr:hypothetical protein [Achromobacter phage emuu_LB7]